jgi:trigger factor
MKAELKEVSPTRREIHLEIPGDALKDAYNAVSKKYSNSANVPGFRKGFAPLDVVRLRYQEEIRSEVLQRVLPDKVTEAIQDLKLQPLSEPQLHLEDAENVKVNGSEPIKLHVHFDVMPEIPMPKYEGLELTRRLRKVEDGEIEDLIANRLQEQAALIPVEGRASELGDTVIADLVGKFDDDPDGEPITADDLEVKLGDEVIEKAFTENLVGVKEDEEKEFTVTYPDEFSSPALAGKTIHYKAKIKSVGQMETPELNDEWAKSLDEGYESLADLRSKLKADMDSNAEMDADARLRNTAIQKLIEENPFEVPYVLIESQARNLLNNFAMDLQNRGVDLNKVEPGFVEMAYHQMQAQAERDVRGAMLLEKIGEDAKVEVTPEEVEEEIARIAEMYRATPEQIKASLEQQGGAGSIDNNLRTRKSIEALIAKAKITEGPWIDETAADEAESDVSAEPDAKDEKKKKPAKPKAKAAEADADKKPAAKKAAKAKPSKQD